MGGLDASVKGRYVWAMTQTMPLLIHTQYVKSLNFDSPGAPLSLAPNETPKLSVSVSMDGKEFNDIEGFPGKPYEVILKVEASAVTPSGETLFKLDLSYGMFMTIAHDVPKEHHHPLLMIEGPKLGFPFMRQIVAEVTQNSGFPPMMLSPVNFEELYRQQYAQQQAV